MGQIAHNESEEMALLHVAAFMLPVVLAAAGAWISAQSVQAAAWLINHQIMVEPANALIPVTAYAGIELVRLIAIIAIACTISFAVARLRTRRRPVKH